MHRQAPKAPSFGILKQTPPGRNPPARLPPGRFHTWGNRRGRFPPEKMPTKFGVVALFPGIKPQRQTWLASSRAESGRADYPMCENGLEVVVLGDSALGASALESRSWGLWGLGDASVHRWRRSDATGAATAQP